MITPQMTPDEAVRDLMKDASWLMTQLTMTAPAARRWLLEQMRRTGSPQAARWYDRRSPRGNEWHILWQVQIDDLGAWRMSQGYFTMIQADNGPHVFIPLMGGDQNKEGRQLTFVLTPHFLKRYRERMELGDGLSTMQLIRRYVKMNPDGGIEDAGHKHKGVESYLFTTREGTALGGFCTEDVFLCSTFIAHSMTRAGRQERRVNKGQQTRRDGRKTMREGSPQRTLQAARAAIRRAEEAMGGVKESDSPGPTPENGPENPNDVRAGDPNEHRAPKPNDVRAGNPYEVRPGDLDET